MKKIMISCGLKGRENPPAYRDACEKAVTEYYSGNCEILHAHGGKAHEVTQTYAGNRVYGLGFNIQNELALCDEAVFMDNWQDFDGCRCEQFIAAQYGIKCVYLKT